MSIVVNRFFCGGYTPDYDILRQRKYLIIKPFFNGVLSVINQNNGFGLISGIVKKQGSIYSDAELYLFIKSSKSLIWSTRSGSDGEYVFRNLAKGLECFVIAFDQNNQYNAVIQDKVVAK